MYFSTHTMGQKIVEIDDCKPPEAKWQIEEVVQSELYNIYILNLTFLIATFTLYKIQSLFRIEGYMWCVMWI